jgi:hypothetical protein
MVTGKEFIIMRKRALLWVAVIGLLSSAIAAAADIGGKWKAEFTTPDGQARVT